MPRTKNQRIIDADVHHQFPSWSALEPYLPEGIGQPYYGGESLPSAPGYFRQDAAPPKGGLPGCNPEFVAEDLFDRYEIEYGVLNPGSTLAIVGLPDVDLAAAIARATNDWTINDWFPVDERFLGSIIVSPSDPDQAADEIRRVGHNPRMVQVTATSAPCLLGERYLHPIYEACEEVNLPFNLHPGGSDAGVNNSYALGNPLTACELRAGVAFPGLYHLISLVTQGVFVKYPNFRFILCEWGVAWLPFVLWRLDMDYRAAREEVPWITCLPSEQLRKSVRVATQPLEEPTGGPADMVKLLELVHGEELLMYSSDYPHWNFDNPEVILRVFPDEWKQKIFYDNAYSWFNLEERLAPNRALASVG